jgi:hypothetical protein
MKRFTVVVHVEVDIEFEDSRATEKSAEFVACERFLYFGKEVPLRSNELGNVVARQVGRATAQSVKEAGEPLKADPPQEDLWAQGRWGTG